MSLLDIMSELPKLTREQREEIASKIAEMDGDLWLDETVSQETRGEIERRLAEIKQGKVAWSPWGEVKERVAGKLRAS